MRPMIRSLLALSAALVLALPSPALAWWEYGHQTVARIALTQAAPQTRRAIRRLIAHSRDIGTPTCPIRSIEDASIWPDCIRGLKERFNYTYIWHYQDADICAPFDLTAPCRDGNCVSAQITRNAKLLADKTLPPRERLMALAFLVHFVGDLHQPLHAGSHNDQGGNKIQARYGIAGGKINLHGVWDGYLAERAISTPPGGAAGLLSGVSATERAAIASGTVADWSRESWQVSHDATYATAFADPCGATGQRATIDETKITTLIPIVRHQVLRGGLRLGTMLDAALAKG